jgi:hypothetical protein
LDAMQEQEHMLIEICTDTNWKYGDDHTLLLPFEIQIPFVWSRWTCDSPSFQCQFSPFLGPNSCNLPQHRDIYLRYALEVLAFLHAPP